MSGGGELQALLEDAVAQGVFPSAQAAVIHRGVTRFSGVAGPGTAQTLFDVSSVTKVLCTTTAFLSLWGEGKLGPASLLSRFFPDAAAAKAGATLEDLLTHRSGLPAFRPYFARVMPAVPELFDAACPASVWAEVRREVVEAVKKTSPLQPLRAGAVYSDVGFMLLGEVLAHVAGAPLDALFSARVAGPAGLTAHFRPPSQRSPLVAPAAPTGTARPREPAPGQEKEWEPFPAHPSRPGEVDDDNAWVMDGVSGHAGLFTTAADLARYGQLVLEELEGAGRFAPAPLWQQAVRKDAATPGSSRALGFDTPVSTPQRPSSAGTLGQGPRGAVGHLGFTGVSLWMDLDRALVVALCTNRTALGRSNLGIRDFRPRFHDGVLRALALEGA